jgi:hypothetical protein
MADDKLPGISEHRRNSPLSGKQQSQNFADKQTKEDLAANTKAMSSLIAAIKEGTEEKKAETKLTDDVTNIEKLISKYGLNELKNEFTMARKMLEDPKASEEEKALALETIEVIRENAESEEERREKAKEQAEANSLLLKMSNGLDKVASGIENFTSNALAAGGLIATALLFIDPEKFFEILRKGLEGMVALVEAFDLFIKGDFKGAWERLGQDAGSVTGVLLFISAFIIGPLIRGLSAVFKILRSVGTGLTKAFNFFKKGLNFLKPSNIKNVFGNLVQGIKNFFGRFKDIGARISGFFKGPAGGKIVGIFGKIGKLIGKLFIPVAAIWYSIQGIIAGFKKEGSFFEKIETGLKTTFRELLGFFIDLPQWLIGKFVGLFSKEKGQSIIDFDTRGLIDQVTEFLFFGPARMIRDFLSNAWASTTEMISTWWESFNFKTWITESILDPVINFFSNLGTKIKEAFLGAVESVGNFISDIGDTISNFIKGVLRAGLPDPGKPWYSISGAAARLVPDAVYEYAGINPDTGEIMDKGDVGSGSEMLATSQENAQSEAGTNKQTVVTAVTQQNSPSTNSNTNVVMAYSPTSPTSGDLASASANNR